MDSIFQAAQLCLPLTNVMALLFVVLLGVLPGWLIALENAALAPFVAAATFIGSMGNIPLATVLNANGVLFAGIMGFIYSDLMVPPLVQVNAKYYGWKTALYIAGVMFVSIVATALILNGIFALVDIVPEGRKGVTDITQFEIDCTFWMNTVSVLIAGTMRLFRKKNRICKTTETDTSI